MKRGIVREVAGIARVAHGSVVGLLLIALVIRPVEARHHGGAAPGEPGVFDYYLLSLSWSPAFCSERPDSPECRSPKPFGFIVHGLWPQYERGFPKNCDGPPLPAEVEDGVMDVMPSRKLIRHEWQAHGRCSGLAAADHFALLKRARAAVTVPSALVSPQRPLELSPAEVVGAFVKANRALTEDAIVVTCSAQTVPRLREVRLCLTRELEPRACSAATRHPACKAPEVLMPPLR
jgi:ribonuclease T2